MRLNFRILLAEEYNATVSIINYNNQFAKILQMYIQREGTCRAHARGMFANSIITVKGFMKCFISYI